MLRLASIIYHHSRVYDLITIGPYAKKVARTLAVHSKIHISMLSIWTQNNIVQPSLIPLGSATVPVLDLNSQFSNMEVGVAVKQINPEISQVTLQNGNKYRYRQLVYSGQPNQWKQNPINSNKNQSNIYNDYQYENIEDLFKLKSGSIVFIIPKDPHFAYQNLFMLLLQARMEKNKKREANDILSEQIQITVLCEGEKLFPFNQQFNTLLQNLFKQRKIKVMRNVSYKIDENKKIIMPNSHDHIKYDYLFQYVCAKCPKVLQNSKINPYESDIRTLSHQKYPNIYIIGNAYKNAYSLHSANEMCNVISKNVIYNMIGVRKRAIYDPQSMFTIWQNDQECTKVLIGKDDKKIKKNHSNHKLFKYWLSLKGKLYGKSQIQTLVNYEYLGNSKPQIENQPLSLK